MSRSNADRSPQNMSNRIRIPEIPSLTTPVTVDQSLLWSRLRESSRRKAKIEPLTKLIDGDVPGSVGIDSREPTP